MTPTRFASALAAAALLFALVAAGVVGQTHWVARTPSVNVLSRTQHAMAFDARRGRLVLFGGTTIRGKEGDTWEWDGVRWTQMAPAVSPPARYGHAMVYDPHRGRVVLFGGSASSYYGYTNDTWEWDGKAWVQGTPLVRPSSRTEHAMVYDPVRKRVVLFGGMNGLGYLSDMWEWDGASWKRLALTVAPQERSGHTMAYDSARKRIVLFGGQVGSVWTNVTWEWDGKSWVRLAPKSKPPVRREHAMAFDPVRKRVVLHGGYPTMGPTLSDTWEWDGKAWVQRVPKARPPAAAFHAMVWDAARRRIVSFGGNDNSVWEYDGATWSPRAAPCPPARWGTALVFDALRSRSVVFGGYYGGWMGDTWEWDGNAWARPLTTLHPSARGDHAMVFDTARGRTVLFGGSTSSPYRYVNDTWEWDGVAWALRKTPVAPSARASHAMAYDAGRGRTVLFGGNWAMAEDVWEWDGTTWHRRGPSYSPAAMWPTPRSGHAMAYDARRRRVVMFGGATAGYRELGDTWEWDGTRWFRPAPVNSPVARRAHAMVYDAARGRVVLHGGFAGYVPFSDTWEWDGVNWSQAAPGITPPAGSTLRMAFDVARQRSVAFGFAAGTGAKAGNDVWEYSGTALTISGTPRPGHTVNLRLTSIGDVGRPYQIGSSLGAGPIALAGRTLGLSIDGMLLVSVTNAWPQVFRGYRGTIATNGHGAAAIAIPAASTLVGLKIYSAYVTLDPAGPSGVRSISNTASITIVR